MRFGDALSFLLLVDKFRNNKDKIKITQLPEDYVKKLRLQIPEDMNKLIVDVTLSLFDRSGYRRWEAEEVASFVLKAKRKEYGGMFEAVIESMIEGREEAWAEGHAEGHAEGWKGGREEVARNALAEGASIEFVTKVTGLDMETVKRLASE